METKYHLNLVLFIFWVTFEGNNSASLQFLEKKKKNLNKLVFNIQHTKNIYNYTRCKVICAHTFVQ